MRKITDIYEEYKIIPSLQFHQLRVAAVARQICDSLDIQIDKETLITACLLHDMGNVIKFDLVQTKLIFNLSDVEIKDVASTQSDFIRKYGNNEHEATVKIIRELSLPENIAELANQNRFSYMCHHRGSNDMMMKIIHYADGRVGPHGVLSYDGRMNDAGKRYKNHPLSIEETEHQKLVDCGKDIEIQIFSHSNIKPEDITDESVKDSIELLKNFLI